MAFRNEPQMTNSNKEGMVKRYKHQPISLDHYGTHFSIKENGKVTISKVASVGIGNTSEEVEYDEIEVSASLIFKIAMFLKATQTIEYVNIKDASPQDLAAVRESNSDRSGGK